MEDVPAEVTALSAPTPETMQGEGGDFESKGNPFHRNELRAESESGSNRVPDRRLSKPSQDGTGAAEHAPVMTKTLPEAVEANQIAARDEQELPGARWTAGSGSRRVGSTGSRGGVGTVEESELRGPRSNGSVPTNLGPAFSVGALEGVGSLRDREQVRDVELPGGGMGRSVVTDHLILGISRHAVELREMKADSMAVVLRPDAHTEIFLKLKNQDGLVEVQARFERGDFNLLSSQWGQLQQSLGSQGVRLGALGGPLGQQTPGTAPGQSPAPNLGSEGQGRSPAGGGGGFRQEERESRSTPRTLDELGLGGSPSEPLRPRGGRPGARRVFEGWA